MLSGVELGWTKYRSSPTSWIVVLITVYGARREGEPMNGKGKVEKGIDQVKTMDNYTDHGHCNESWWCPW